MFIERLSKKYKANEPIFTDDIIELFSDYSRAQVFRYIKKAKERKEIVQYAFGIYYIPNITFLGELSTISADDVIIKRYLKNKNEVYGVYSGIKLLNNFSITTQMAAVIEIVSNNETMRCREININSRKFILRKSRLKINANNFAAYTVMQLFSDFANSDELNESARKYLLEYMKEYNITSKQLFDMADSFPARTTKNLLRSGIINEIAH